MADRIQQRRDTAARWAQYNPILLEGEVGYVTDNPNQYKIGDGVHAWNDLPLRGFDGTLVHELGYEENTALSTDIVSKYLKTILDNGSEITDYELNEGYWNSNTDSVGTVNKYWYYTSKIAVKRGQLIMARINVNTEINGRLIVYYNNQDKKLFTTDAYNRESLVYIEEDGYIISCFPKSGADSFKIYNITNDSLLKLFGDKLNIAYSQGLKYALTISETNIIKFDGNSVLFPIGTVFTPPIGISNVSIDESYGENGLLVEKPNDEWGSHYVVINSVLKQARCIRTTDRIILGYGEFLVCLVRWNDCIFEGNFKQYDYNGSLIQLLPTSEVLNYTEITPDDMTPGYFYVSNITAGMIVGTIPIRQDYVQYHCFSLLLKRGTELVVNGTGGSMDSRLYTVIDYNTNECLEIAKPGEKGPKSILYADKDVYVYVSNIQVTCFLRTRYLSTYKDVKLSENRGIFDYAIVMNSQPVLNTTDKTLALPVGTRIIYSPLSYDYTLTEEDGEKICDDFANDWGSFLCYFNIETKTLFSLRSKSKKEINDKTIPLFFIRFPDGILDGKILGTYILNGEEYKLTKNIKVNQEIKSTEFAPKMFNPIINLRKEQLKVLDIGNSYTEDSTHYIPEIVSASGIDVSDMCLYRAIRGSASFKTWWDCYHNLDNASYSISRVVGEIEQDVSGTAAANNGEKFRNTLNNNKWDLIIIHQVSTYAPYYDRWNENNNAGYLDKFIRLLRKLQPEATIGFLLVHSYWSGYGGNAEKSSLDRWKLIAQSAMRLRANYGIDFIIPYGTAIQNLRASSLNNDYDLTADGTHCANGLADYTAACAYFQSLFAPRYGVSILGNSARITVEQNETYPSSDISVTDENAPIAQLAAMAACYNWYECINPEDIEDEDLI